MECLLSIMTEMGKCLYEPAKRHVSYLCGYKRKVKDLISKVDNLILIRADIEKRVNEACDNGEQILEQVQRWMTNVEEIETNAKSLDDEVKENRKCFMGWCPDWKSNYLIGKKAAQKMAYVDRLLNEGKNFSRVSNPPPRPTIDLWPTESVEHFSSRDSLREEIIQAIKDEKNIIIGLYGMGGVGKTTEIKEIAKKLKKENVYKEVVMVTVSQNPDVKKIQQSIGEQLGQKFSEEEEQMRASRLTGRLKQENRVLVIFDDVWSDLKLSKIGIPCGDEHRGCKIVLTTRRKDVCDRMRCQESIEMRVLSKKESWDLFKKNAGDAVNSAEINTIAKDIVNECGDLPLALVILGTALRGNGDEATWRNTLVQLRRSDPEDIEGMNEQVFHPLQVSYDFLGNERIKSFFLFCCLFPEDEDIQIEVLLKYGIGGGLLDSEDSLMQARDRVHDWVNTLKASCLLLDGVRKGCVKMHDVVRDVAIFIASRDHGYLVQAGFGREEWPQRDLGERKKISLIHNRIAALPDQPGCPKLQVLLLQENNKLVNIGQNFFEKTEALQVLDLASAPISSLPQSMQQSMNIKILCLDGCYYLKDISLIGGLTKLEILSLRKTGIEELPKEMAQLARLKLLDLTGTWRLKKIPPYVISNMSRMEELYMYNGFSKWEDKDKGDGINAYFWEVASLKHLTILHILVKNVECLSQEIIRLWKNFIKFDVVVSGKSIYLNLGDLRHISCDRNIRVENIPNLLSNWAIKVLAEQTEFLKLVNSNNMQSLPIPLNGLKCLEISQNQGMKHLIVAKEDIPPSALGYLEKLILYDMKNLETFYDGTLPYGFLKKLGHLSMQECPRLRFVFSSALVRNLQLLEKLTLVDCDELEKIISEEAEHDQVEKKTEAVAAVELEKSLSSDIVKLQNPHTFQNLRELLIWRCNRLRNVMSLRLAQGLPNLEKLSVSGCVEMTDITVEEEEAHDDRSILPLLRSIKLGLLPNLKSLYSRRHDDDGIFLKWPSLTLLEVDKCPELKRLCIGPESAPDLGKIRGEEEWFLGLEEVKAESSLVSQRLRRLYENSERELQDLIDKMHEMQDWIDRLGWIDELDEDENLSAFGRCSDGVRLPLSSDGNLSAFSRWSDGVRLPLSAVGPPRPHGFNRVLTVLVRLPLSSDGNLSAFSRWSDGVRLPLSSDGNLSAFSRWSDGVRLPLSAVGPPRPHGFNRVLTVLIAT